MILVGPQCELSTLFGLISNEHILHRRKVISVIKCTQKKLFTVLVLFWTAPALLPLEKSEFVHKNS